MKWELDMLYPGLQMRVGPYHGMNSVLEFVLDPDQDHDGARKAFYSNESPSVGKHGKLIEKERLKRSIQYFLSLYLQDSHR